MSVRKIALAIIACGMPAVAQDSHLLPPTAVASEIRSLQSSIGNGTIGQKRAEFLRVRRNISRFVTRQIQAYPAISKCDLQKQLRTAFSVRAVCGDLDEDGPLVFAEPLGSASKRRLIVVAYCLWLGFHGSGGAETVIESYLWEPDQPVKVAASLVPAGFSGVFSRAAEVTSFPDPDRYWILVAGLMSGASGRVLGGTAAVFEVGISGIRPVWTAPSGIGNIRAYAHPLNQRWEIEYADASRFYNELPRSTWLDIFRVDWPARTYRRIVHEPLD